MGLNDSNDKVRMGRENARKLWQRGLKRRIPKDSSKVRKVRMGKHD